MTERRWMSPPSSSGDCEDVSRTPSGALRASRVARSAWKRGSETMVPLAGSGASSAAVTNVSSASRPSLMSDIDALLERGDADAAHGVEETFVSFARIEIDADHVLHLVDDLVDREGGAEDLADAGILRARAAQLKLVEFDTLLVDAQDADVAGVMMAAGIDAAGDLDLELADLVLAVEIGEALGDLLRDRDRARIGEVAIIEPRAGDDVGDEPGIGRAKAERFQPREDRGQILLAHMRQDEVLFVTDADFRDAEFVHQPGQRIKLRIARIARHAADGLERYRDDGIARRAVQREVAQRPVVEIPVADARGLECLA